MPRELKCALHMVRLFLLLVFLNVEQAVAEITEAEIESVQKEWGAGIVNIAAKKKEGQSKDYLKALADQFVDNFYAHSVHNGKVLIKAARRPDGESNPSFQLNRDDAIKDLVGEDDKPGFATQSWKEIKFENAGVVSQGDMALALGTCILTSESGDESKMEYSLGYTKDTGGKVRISLFHTSRQGNSGSESSEQNSADSASSNEGRQSEEKKEEETTTTTTTTTTEAVASTAETTTTTTSATTTTSSTTTTTTTTSSRKSILESSASDDFEVGRKRKDPATGGFSFVRLLMQLFGVLLVFLVLAGGFFFAKVKTHPGMSFGDRVKTAGGLANKSMEKSFGSKGHSLPMSNGHGYDKNV